MWDIDFTDDELGVAYVTADTISKYLSKKLKDAVGPTFARTYNPVVLQPGGWNTPRDLTIDILHWVDDDDDYEALQAFMDKKGCRTEEELFTYFLNEQFGEYWNFKFFVEDRKGCYIVRIME